MPKVNRPLLGSPSVRLAYWAHLDNRKAFDMPKVNRSMTSPDVRLVGANDSGEAGARLLAAATKADPTVRLAHGPGAQGDRTLLMDGRQVNTLLPEQYPGLLVSFFYLKQFLKNRHRYCYRDWVMDSGAFSAHNSGVTIDLKDYIETCKQLMVEDPFLTEIYSLDVIGDWKGSLDNTEKMWAEGVPAIPCFHAGEPWSALMDMAKRYPKIALGGVALANAKKKLEWAKQCFARVWRQVGPKKFHGFAFCYESAVLGLPFHCMTDDHQVLTTEGWKDRQQINKGDLVLTFNDGISTWQPVLDVYDYEAEDVPVMHFDNRAMSARVTLNHRWRVWNTRTQKWVWTTTDRLVNSDRIPRTADYQAPTEPTYDDSFVELFAWYWTEGSVKIRQNLASASVQIVQSLTANPAKVEAIRKALKASKEQYAESTVPSRDPKSLSPDSIIVQFELYGKIANNLLLLSPNKEIPMQFLLQLTRPQLELFIRTSVAGDGWNSKRVTTDNHFAIGQKDGRNIDQFRIACLLAGYATSYYKGNSIGPTGKPCSMEFTQSVSNQWIIPKPCGRDPEGSTGMRRKVISYTGHLWCIRVPSGAFFTKCNQHIFVTGNSVDSTSWEISACKYGNWKAFGNQRVSVRGSNQNLKIEVEWYLDLEWRARQKWKKQMALLESVSPTVRPALAGTGSDTYLKEGGAVQKALSCPTIRLAEGGEGGRIEAKSKALKKREK